MQDKMLRVVVYRLPWYYDFHVRALKTVLNIAIQGNVGNLETYLFQTAMEQ